MHTSVVPEGVSGSFSSTLFEDACQLVVGASGCIFGLVGLYVADIALNFESLTLPWLRLGAMIAGLIFLIVTQVRSWGSRRASVPVQVRQREHLNSGFI